MTSAQAKTKLEETLWDLWIALDSIEFCLENAASINRCDDYLDEFQGQIGEIQTVLNELNVYYHR